MTETRLTIVTNQPLRAVRDVLGVAFTPPWLKIVTEVRAVSGLPNGTKAIGQWYEPRKFRSALEWAWIERRLLGGILGLSSEDCEKLAAWVERNGGSPDGLGIARMIAASELAGSVVSERVVDDHTPRQINKNSHGGHV